MVTNSLLKYTVCFRESSIFLWAIVLSFQVYIVLLPGKYPLVNYTGCIYPQVKYTGCIYPQVKYTRCIYAQVKYTGCIYPQVKYTRCIYPQVKYTRCIYPQVKNTHVFTPRLNTLGVFTPSLNTPSVFRTFSRQQPNIYLERKNSCPCGWVGANTQRATNEHVSSCEHYNVPCLEMSV